MVSPSVPYAETREAILQRNKPVSLRHGTPDT